MAGIDFRSLFTEQPQRQPSGGPGAESQWRIKPTSFAEDDQDPRFPAFQDAWKRGTGLQDLFGPDTFGLHGTVAPSGGDNHRPDVAKVQTLLGEAGYVGIRDGGPNGYPSDMLDSAIRQFQRDKGLKVDGVLKPGGPTITALGGLLGSGAYKVNDAPENGGLTGTLKSPGGLFGEFNSGSNSIAPGEWDWQDQKIQQRDRPDVALTPEQQWADLLRRLGDNGTGVKATHSEGSGGFDGTLNLPKLPQPQLPDDKSNGDALPQRFPGMTPPHNPSEAPVTPSSFMPMPKRDGSLEEWGKYKAEYEAWVRDNWEKIQKNKELQAMGLPPLDIPSPPLRPGEARELPPGVLSFAPSPDRAATTAQPPAPTAPKTQKPDAWVDWLRENSRKKTSSQNAPNDPYPNHTISEDGASEHDNYAQGLVRDSNPNETARYLKNVITWNGAVGRGDVADLLGRFAKIDGAKAKTLQDALHQASGERIPFRIAPLGQNSGGAMADLAEGNTTPTAPTNPFGPSEGADRWEAGNMAKALLGRSDYKDAIKHFQGEVAKDRTGAMPYLAAVHEEMAGKNPELAGKFAMQMEAAGLAMKTEAVNAAGDDTVASGSGDDTLTGNNGNDTVNGEGSQDGPKNPPTGDQAPPQGGQNPSDQQGDEQVAGIPEPRKPTDAEILKNKTDILTGTVKPDEGKEEGRPGLPVPPPDRTPMEVGKETAELMGLRPDLIKNDQDAVIMQGVANFRFLGKEAQNKVMEDVGKLRPDLRGQLQAKVADLQLQPQWNARSMTDKELGDAVLRNDWNAQALKALSVAPGPGGEAFGWYAEQFEQSAERMRIELTRRGLNKETH